MPDRNFAADENVAADQRDQARERGGQRSADSRDQDAPQPAKITDTRGLERDGNGEPLGGMVPEDDID